MSAHIYRPTENLRRFGAAPSPDSIRFHDTQDVESWIDASRRKLAELARVYGPIVYNALIEGYDPESELLAAGSIGADPYGRGDETGNPYGNCSAQNGGAGSQPDPGCDARQNCQADMMPFMSRGKGANWPLPGNGTFVSASFNATPTTYTIRPGAFYFRGFNAALTAIVCECVRVDIGPSQQLLSNDSLTSQVFADLCCEVPVAWARVTPQLPAVLTFGHTFAADISLIIYGVIWGDRNR